MNKETELKRITSNGFNLEESSERDIDLASISLKIALKAYFSTYHCYKGEMNRINSDFYKDLPDNLKYCDVLGKLILVTYCEAYTECIIHFHHFAELVCKNFLRHDNPLLVDFPSNNQNTVLKYKIIKNELSLKDENNIKTIGFLETLNALLQLIQAKDLKNDYYKEQLSFMPDHKEMLEKLNALRNKVWHRGLYILNYEALDELVGMYILPFVDEVTKHENYRGYQDLWHHKKLDCGIDPITEIINHFEKVKKGECFNIEKVAFLKELGRAAYNNYGKHIEAIEKKALVISRNNYDSAICKCPVCGVNSLIIYKYVDYELDKDGEYESLSSWPTHVKCECCSFELHDDIKNASEYGLEGIREYWV
jgi:hypothetical protein